MITSKKIAATALWIVTTALAHGKTIHGGPHNDQVLAVSTGGQYDPPIYYLECIALEHDIPSDQITVEWTTSDGDDGTTSACIEGTITKIPIKFPISHHQPKWISGHVHYTGSIPRKIFLTGADKNGNQIRNVISPYTRLTGDTGSTCSVHVPSSISFDRVKKGDVLEKTLTDNGQGQGTLTFQPDHYTNSGGTIVNGQSAIEYDVAGVDWNPSLIKYETKDIVTPHSIELKASGDLAAGTYTGKMVVTITCN